MSQEKGNGSRSKTSIKFTKKAIDDIVSPPEGKRTYVYDTLTRGLCIGVTPRGTKSFYLYRKIEGRADRIRIGPYPDLTIEAARCKAAEYNAMIANGINPRDEIRGSRKEWTLDRLFREYIDRNVTPYRKPKTAENYTHQFNRYLRRWKTRRISAIKRSQIQSRHAQIGRDHGPYIANRVLALLSAMYGKAIAWEAYKGENPAKGVQKFREKSRDRFIQADELPRFFQALSEEENVTARECILLCLLTGARRGNVQAMRWEELDLNRGTWRIPDTKSGEDITIPLVPLAQEILGTRREAAEESPWVFPGRFKDVHIKELRFAWIRILKRAEIENLRLHDLRRTMGSWQAAQGASLTIIGKSLGHKSPGSTSIYSRLNLDPVRESMDRAASAILIAAEVADGSKVTKIRGGGPND